MSEQPPLMVLPESALRAPRKPKYPKRGHAAPPGTGPEGETCASCLHLERKVMAKADLKCGLMRAHWTGGYGTDVRAGDAACSRWESARGMSDDVERALFGKPRCAKGYGDCHADCEYGLAGPCINEIAGEDGASSRGPRGHGDPTLPIKLRPAGFQHPPAGFLREPPDD
jgi:hypothetical protein